MNTPMRRTEVVLFPEGTACQTVDLATWDFPTSVQRQDEGGMAQAYIATRGTTPEETMAWIRQPPVVVEED